MSVWTEIVVRLIGFALLFAVAMGAVLVVQNFLPCSILSAGMIPMGRVVECSLEMMP